MQKKTNLSRLGRRLVALCLSLVTFFTLFAGMPLKAEAATYDSYYYPKYTGSSGSIIKALQAIGVDSSYSFRSKIAAANKISNYRGTAEQNTKMVNLLKKGQLVNPNAKTTLETSNTYYPKYTGSSGSIIKALQAIGVDSSYSYRCKIAAANSISGYRGTAAQNTKMVSLLKQGKLINPDATQKHTHTLRTVSGSSNVQIRYCRCGYFESRKQGVVQQSSVALNNGYIVSPEEIAIALAALKAAVAEAASLVPYVIIPVVVSGVAWYAYVNCSSTTGELVDVKEMSAEYKPEELKNGKFYYTAVYREKEKTTVMILYNDGISLDEAKKYMRRVATCKSILATEIGSSTVALSSLYTPRWDSAEKLCEQLARSGNFRYGGDSYPDKNFGCNTQKLEDNVLYYRHFHLYFDRYGLGQYKKVANCHIFFDVPYTKASYQAA